MPSYLHIPLWLSNIFQSLCIVCGVRVLFNLDINQCVHTHTATYIFPLIYDLRVPFLLLHQSTMDFISSQWQTPYIFCLFYSQRVQLCWASLSLFVLPHNAMINSLDNANTLKLSVRIIWHGGSISIDNTSVCLELLRILWPNRSIFFRHADWTIEIFLRSF